MIYLVFLAFNDNLLEQNHAYKSLTCSLAFSCNFVRFECDVYNLNCRGLSSNWESFRSHLYDLNDDTFSFEFIGISELYQCCNDSRLSLP